MSDGAGTALQPNPAPGGSGPSIEFTVIPVPEDNGTRAVVVRLLPNGAQDRKLRKLADAASKPWNEVNY